VRNNIWVLRQLFSLLILPKGDRTKFELLNKIVRDITTEIPSNQVL